MDRAAVGTPEFVKGAVLVGIAEIRVANDNLPILVHVADARCWILLGAWGFPLFKCGSIKDCRQDSSLLAHSLQAIQPELITVAVVQIVERNVPT
jgi:hypothetical protein